MSGNMSLDFNKVGCKYPCTVYFTATHTGVQRACVQTFLNSQIVLQLSADVLRRMRESDNAEPQSSVPDSQKDVSSELQRLHRSIWDSPCVTRTYKQCFPSHTEHERQQFLVFLLHCLTDWDMLYLLIVLIFTHLFFRCKTNGALTNRNTGRDPPKVSAHTEGLVVIFI